MGGVLSTTKNPRRSSRKTRARIHQLFRKRKNVEEGSEESRPRSLTIDRYDYRDDLSTAITRDSGTPSTDTSPPTRNVSPFAPFAPFEKPPVPTLRGRGPFQNVDENRSLTSSASASESELLLLHDEHSAREGVSAREDVGHVGYKPKHAFLRCCGDLEIVRPPRLKIDSNNRSVAICREYEYRADADRNFCVRTINKTIELFKCKGEFGSILECFKYTHTPHGFKVVEIYPDGVDGFKEHVKNRFAGEPGVVYGLGGCLWKKHIVLYGPARETRQKLFKKYYPPHRAARENCVLDEHNMQQLFRPFKFGWTNEVSVWDLGPHHRSTQEPETEPEHVASGETTDRTWNLGSPAVPATPRPKEESTMAGRGEDDLVSLSNFSMDGVQLPGVPTSPASKAIPRVPRAPASFSKRQRAWETEALKLS